MLEKRDVGTNKLVENGVNELIAGYRVLAGEREDCDGSGGCD